MKPPKKWHIHVILQPCATFKFDEVPLLALSHLLCVCGTGFGLEIEILEIWGHVIYRWKDIFKTFPMIDYTAQCF